MFYAETMAEFGVEHGPELLVRCIFASPSFPSPQMLLTGQFRQGWGAATQWESCPSWSRAKAHSKQLPVPNALPGLLI